MFCRASALAVETLRAVELKGPPEGPKIERGLEPVCWFRDSPTIDWDQTAELAHTPNRPLMEGESINEFARPRSIWQLIGDTFALYRRFPILFLALAAVAVVPYELIVLAMTGAGPFAQGGTGFLASNLLTVADSFLILPLISALHVRAVYEIDAGSRPRLLPTFRDSLRTLPVVAVATGISSVAILFGFFALFVPGALLTARWAVVAQTAALDGGGWKDPLRHSAALTRDYRWHSFGLVIVAGLIAALPVIGLGLIFGHRNTTVASFLVGTAVEVLLRSYAALATALLYFDLRARHRVRARGDGAPEEGPNVPPSAASTGTGDPLTPDGYTDTSRPRGWYIDPDQPSQMRYWGTDDENPGWSQRTAKTPKQTLADW